MEYTVRYFYCNKKNRKYIKHDFWIYPKMYASIIDEETYEKLKTNKAFLCNATAAWREDGKVRKVGFIASITPATEDDLKNHTKLDLITPITPSEGQEEAIKNFMKIKFNIEA